MPEPPVRRVGAHGHAPSVEGRAARLGGSLPKEPAPVGAHPRPERSRGSDAPAPPSARRGPKTARGRAAVSRNAIKHGIMSPHPVIIEGLETVAAWEQHSNGIVDALAPEGALERELAEVTALLLWRLRRVTRHETAVISHQVHGTADNLAIADAYRFGSEADVPDPDPIRVAVHQETRVIPLGDDLDNIMRYGAFLHRLWVQTLHELEALQARRRGQPTHLARLDISSPPAP